MKLEIEKRIKQLLVSELKVNRTVIDASSPNAPLLGRGIGLDSVETMALVVSLEEEFGIYVPDAQLTVDLFASIGSLTDYVVDALLERTNVSVNPDGRS